jgi:DNA-binding response OmpR family regulator
MKGSLTGRSILVVEDEPIIAMAISQALEESGAEVTTTNTLRHALLLVEHDGLSAAILDHSLGDGNSSLLYARLKERGIPYQRLVLANEDRATSQAGVAHGGVPWRG